MAITITYLFVGVAFGALNNCYAPLDVMFLQDTTGSYVDDLPNIRNQLPPLTSSILGQHRGSAFGVAEFRDKPYFPLGMEDDFCYKLDPAGALSRSLSDFYWAYSGLIASGGGDIPEATFQAIINVILDPQVGWAPTNRLAAESESVGGRVVGRRLLFLITDAPTHLPGDIDKYSPEEFPDLPRNLPPNNGGLPEDGDVTYTCLHEDYPGPEQIKAVVTEHQINLIIITPDNDTITPGWTWVNEVLLEQPDYFYQKGSSDSTDFHNAVLRVLSEISAHCIEETSEPEQPCYPCPPCPPPCLPPCPPQCLPEACCDSDGLFVILRDPPKSLVLDVDF